MTSTHVTCPSTCTRLPRVRGRHFSSLLRRNAGRYFLRDIEQCRQIMPSQVLIVTARQRSSLLMTAACQGSPEFPGSPIIQHRLTKGVSTCVWYVLYRVSIRVRLTALSRRPRHSRIPRRLDRTAAAAPYRPRGPAPTAVTRQS